MKESNKVETRIEKKKPTKQKSVAIYYRQNSAVGLRR